MPDPKRKRRKKSTTAAIVSKSGRVSYKIGGRYVSQPKTRRIT
jgi:hypothetical protein